MAPSQVSIDPDPKKKPVIVGKMLVTQEDKDMRCVINREDTPFVSSDQKVPAPFATESMGVDIVECTDSPDIRMAEADEPNATECSSSFSDTGSGTDDGSKLSDAEVESRFSFGNDRDSNLFDEFVSLFPARKKKLTAQWRDYIHPLMWRCKWIELRIKELQSQSLKYDRELAYYDRRKQQELGKVSDTRSSSFGVQSYKKKVMKRRKRNRIEDKVDISSYMSHHNLFSYYECKRSDAEGASVDEAVFSGDIKKNDDGGIKDACPSGEFGDDQNPLEKVIFDIERMQCRVKKLKIQIDELLTVHAKKISSMGNMSLPVQSDLPSNSAQSPVSSPRNGDTVPIGALPQHIPEYDVRDLLMPEGVSAGEPTPDIIESTVQMLLKPQNGDLPEPIVDEVLINNQKAEENLNDFERITGMPTENMFQQVVKEEPQERDVPLVPDPKPDTCQGTQIAQEQYALKSSLASDFITATHKRKRDQRKARSGVWKADNIFSQPSVGKTHNE